MKKRKREQRMKWKISRKQKLLASLMGLAMVVGLAVGGYLWKVEEKTVSAHPTSVITLDPGGSNEYKVPVDGTNLQEPELIAASPLYDNFVQSDQVIPIIEKGYITAYGSPAMKSEISIGNTGSIEWTVISVEQTNFGNFFVVYNSAGTNLGGMVRVEVFNKKGVLLDSNYTGSMLNVNYRVSLGVINKSSTNEFLVYTSGTNYFKYAVTGESDTTATITRTSITAYTTPTTVVKSHLVRNVERFSNYTNFSWVAGEIYYDGVASRNGVIPGKVGVGEVDNSGWQSSSFSGVTNYLYSIDNLLPTEIGYPGNKVYLRPDIAVDANSHVYGTLQYFDYNGAAQVSTTLFQIFEKTNSIDAGTGQAIRKRKYVYNPNQNGNQIVLLKEMCTPTEVYFLSSESVNTKLIKVNLTTYTDSVIKVYPKDTILNMIENGDGTVSYYGTTTDLSGEFYSHYYSSMLSSPYYFVQGIMEGPASANPFKVVSLRGLETNAVSNPLHIKTASSDRLFVAGETTDYNKFVDKLNVIGANGATIAPATVTRAAFVGTLILADDYAPAISKLDKIFVDIYDNALTVSTKNSYGWNPLDNWLITGSKNGLLSDPDAVDIYDTYDFKDTLLGTTVADRKNWLLKRINRNPLDVSTDIDWDEMGFDKTRPGPQQVTYFVGDTQLQSSSISRWINKETPQTIKDDKYALDVQNFHVPLSSVATDVSTVKKFKDLANSLAWKITGDHHIDESVYDNIYDNTKVTVNMTQLAALQNATEAKPYPVDVTYKPTAGVTLVNRVWVFVTTKNTVPNNESIYTEVTPRDTNGVAYYADDYTIPLRIAKTHVVQDVLDRGNVKVYDYYDITHETDADCDYDAATGEYNLPTLADNAKNTSRLDITNMTVITGATGACVVQPDVTYKWLEASSNTYHTQNVVSHGTLDVTITADVLLHVRQVIYNDHQDVVIPTQGYLSLKNTTANTMTAMVPSGKETGVAATEPSYDTFAAAIDNLNGNNLLTVTATVPEFYEYKGYVVSDTNTLHKSSLLTKGTYRYDFTSGVYEKWLTVYLTPKLNSSNLPQPYSWDYKLNEFGEVELD